MTQSCDELISWRRSVEQSLLRLVGGLMLFCAPTSFAADLLYQLPPPCDRSAETGSVNACTKAFLDCDATFGKIQTLVQGRLQQSKTTAIQTGTLIDWSKSTSFIPDEGLHGAKIGATCDLQKPYEECGARDRSLVFRRTGRRIATEFTPGGSGDAQVAAMNGLRFEAMKCYQDQALEEMRGFNLRITSPACLPVAQDLHQLVQKSQNSTNTYLSTVDATVENFCEQDTGMARLCREDVGTQFTEAQIKSRIATCKLEEATTAIRSAWTLVLECEAAARAERNFGAMAFSGMIRKRLELESAASPPGKLAAAKGKSAKKKARRGDKSGAKKKGNEAALALGGLGPYNFQTMKDMAREYFQGPDCWEAPKNLADQYQPQYRLPASIVGGGASEEDPASNQEASSL